MTPRLNEQLENVQKELARKLEEAEHIGECLVKLGNRLREEPWNWSMERMDPHHAGGGALTIEQEMADSLDRHHVEWLLEDIRILKRREVELKKLAA